MTYILKAGVLYGGVQGERPLISIRGRLCGSQKQILGPNDKLLFYTDIRRLDALPREAGDVRCKEYVMYAADGSEYAVAKPRYASGDDPSVAGWPICRMPRADQALLRVGQDSYTLVMENVQNYLLTDAAGRCMVRIVHLGLGGGWKLELTAALSPAALPAAFLCGLFVFCRYLEKENEFLVV